MVNTGNYVSINTTDTKTMLYYIIKFLSYAFELQEDITTSEQVCKSVELAIRSEYLIDTREKINCIDNRNTIIIL